MCATEWTCRFVCDSVMCKFVLKVWLFHHKSNEKQTNIFFAKDSKAFSHSVMEYLLTFYYCIEKDLQNDTYNQIVEEGKVLVAWGHTS